MKITIRPVTEADFPILIELFREFAAFEKLPEKMTNSIEQMLAEQEYFHCFVAETSTSEIAGYVTYFYAYYTWIGKSMYMDDLYVRPYFRGKGIGNKLINAVIDFARQSECRKLRWQVSNWNHPAIAFYQQLGAEINSVENNCDLLL